MISLSLLVEAFNAWISSIDLINVQGHEEISYPVPALLQLLRSPKR